MNLEISTPAYRTPPPPADKAPTSAAKLSPELAQLLVELKVTLGTKIEAIVTSVSEIAAEDQALLLQKQQSAPRAESRTWQTLLDHAALKLVALKHQGTSFTAISDAPVKAGQTLSLIISARGVQLLAGLETSSATATAADRPSRPEVSSSTTAALPRALSQILQLASAGPSGKAKLAELSSAPHRQSNVSASGLSFSSTQAVAAAIAKVLPKADASAELLSASTRLLATLQTGQQGLPPAVKALLPLLEQLQQHTLEVSSTTPLKANAIARAITHNGIFHERNAVGALHARDNSTSAQQDDGDFKAILIRIVDHLSQLNGMSASATSKTSANTDAVARLWLGLVNTLPNKSQTQLEHISAKENQLLTVQALAQSALAKIQLNQYRTLGPLTPEQAPNSPLLIDLPIKWPDAYGNAFLQIYPPKEREDLQEQKKSKRYHKSGRWRIFMELELGDEGELAVELTVADRQIGATFWAEKDRLREKANSQLQQLQRDLVAQGLQVGDLRCSQAPPPKQKMHIDYAIIDVKT